MCRYLMDVDVLQTGLQVSSRFSSLEGWLRGLIQILNPTIFWAHTQQEQWIKCEIGLNTIARQCSARKDIFKTVSEQFRI
jgi:hypothetical protein